MDKKEIFGQINQRRFEQISNNANEQNQQQQPPLIQPQRQNNSNNPQNQADRQPNNLGNINPGQVDDKQAQPTLFGLKIRVPEGFFADEEILFLRNINDKISKLDKKEVFTIPSNKKTLQRLLALFYEQDQRGQEAPSKKERVKPNKQPQGQSDTRNNSPQGSQSGQNPQKKNKPKGANNNNNNHNNNNNNNNNNNRRQRPQQEEQKRNDDVQQRHNNNNNYQRENNQNIPNNQRQVSIPRSDTSNNSNSNNNNHERRHNNRRNNPHNEHQNNNPTAMIPQYKGPGIQLSDDKRYYPISRWFFIDQNCRVPTLHSLIYYDKKDPQKFLLNKLWKRIVECQRLDVIQFKLDSVYLTEESYLNELAVIEKYPGWLNTTDNIYISDNSSAFLLSKHASTIDIQTYNSQAAFYSVFDFRAVFTEGDGQDYLRALMFGLFFNILAFQQNQLDIIFAFITNTTISFSIRIVLYDIFCMKCQGKLSEKQIAHSIYYLFKHTQLSNTIINASKALFSLTNNSNFEKSISQFGDQAKHTIIYQNITQFSSKVIPCMLPQHFGVLFIDCTPDGCGVNLVFKNEKFLICMDAYQKLAMSMPYA